MPSGDYKNMPEELREVEFVPQTGWESAKARFGNMPVFPLGMLGFVTIAAVGIWKYRKVPNKNSTTATLYFTRLRIMAQGFAVGMICLGAGHAMYKDYVWSKTHPGEPRQGGS